MAHLLLLVNADQEQHQRLIKSINSRKYPFEGFRKGYNRPHVSELKLYNVRAKKEVLPLIMRDLKVTNVFPDKKMSLKEVWKGPAVDKKGAFLEGRLTYLLQYFLQRTSKLTRIKPVPAPAEGEAVLFVGGWYYAFSLGSIEDIDRNFGEEL